MDNPFARYWPGGGVDPWWLIQPGPRAVRKDGVVIEWSGTASCWMLTTPHRGYSKYRPAKNMGFETLRAHVDREFPRPAPEPMVGQVWCSGAWEVSIAAVLERTPTYLREVWWAAGLGQPTGEVERFTVGEPDPDHKFANQFTRWPPKKALLVWGPGAPWAPPDWNWLPGELDGS